MLKRLEVRGFKSLRHVELRLPHMSVLFGPNAAGKSNLLDAIQALSRIGTQRTLADAFGEPICGYPIEAFAFSSGGLADLLNLESAHFSIESDIVSNNGQYRYCAEVGIHPGSGRLSTTDEFLAQIGTRGQPKGTPAIERVGSHLSVRRKGKPAHPIHEGLGQNHSILSDPRFSGADYLWLETARNELADWRTYYLDPRVAMRAAQPPSDVRDIGVLGSDIAPFLYKLRAENQKSFRAVSRTLRAIVPSVEELTVDLDKRRGTLDLLIRQGGVDYSSRIISEGTLRVLALCAIAVNPWGGSLVAFEEPENGVHPRRLELIADLLLSLALEQRRQVVVTTHSPLLCDAILKTAREHPEDVGLFNVRRRDQETVVDPFDVLRPLFQQEAIAAALAAPTDDGLFEGLVLRGLVDE